MAARLIDALATTEPLAELFSDQSVLQAMLDFESALARAEARVGIIPQSAADAISSAEMHHWTTKEVMVAYDANDPDVAVALDHDGHVLAYLRRERLLGMYHGSSNPALAAETKLAIADSMQERKRLARSLRDGRDALARSVRRNGYLPKVELLHQASLPGSVEDVLTHRPASSAEVVTPTAPMHSEDIGNSLAASLRLAQRTS